MGAVELETDVHSISTEEEMRGQLGRDGRENGRAEERRGAQRSGRDQPRKRNWGQGWEENWGSLESGGRHPRERVDIS